MPLFLEVLPENEDERMLPNSLYEVSIQFSSFQFSLSVVSDSLWPHESQHARPPCSSPTPGVHSDSRPLSQWCHPAISSSVIPFSSCPQCLPASESFPMGQLFAWGGQSTGVSALASFLPKKSQGWYPSEWTGWISLQSKGLSRVFSNTTVQNPLQSLANACFQNFITQGVQGLRAVWNANWTSHFSVRPFSWSCLPMRSMLSTWPGLAFSVACVFGLTSVQTWISSATTTSLV